MIRILSAVLFCLFWFAYLGKIYQLKRRHVQAFHLGEKVKKPSSAQERAVRMTSTAWTILWAAEIAASGYIAMLPLSFHGNTALSITGLAVTAAGLALFVSAMISMRSSWRVGIDAHAKTEFVTRGVYRFSRNPAFVGFDCMFAGLFITYPDMLTAAVLAANLITIHLLILCEEAYLLKMHGGAYESYRKKVRRYI